MERLIMHIDVNNAFLSWTAVDLLRNGYEKDIREEYSVIGGDESERKGVVLAKSPLAKSKGIRTAETLYSARKKVRNLKIYPPNHSLYDKMSLSLFNYIKTYTIDVEVVSIDECFIDYGKVKKLYGDEESFAYKLKDEILNKFGFTVNIGIANNKLCAKIASDFSKPNKVHTLYEKEIKSKMWPLDVGELYGVGRKSCEKLKALNINTIGELANSSYEMLYKYFKNKTKYIINIANGIDEAEVISEKDDPKSISMTKTLIYDYDNVLDINKEIKEISVEVSKQIRQQNKYARVITIIIKDKYFKTITHQKKIKNGTNISNNIYEIGKELFREVWDKIPVRLIGIRLDCLEEANDCQLSLFENHITNEKDEKLEKTLDILREKYGDKII